jgi:hypothetical protein
MATNFGRVAAVLLAGFAGTQARAHHSVEEQYELLAVGRTVTIESWLAKDGGRSCLSRFAQTARPFLAGAGRIADSGRIGIRG